MIIEIPKDSLQKPPSGHYRIGFGTPTWYFFKDSDFNPDPTLGHLAKMGYTHYCPGTMLPASAVQAPETAPVPKRLDELNVAHKKALERLTNQERDHQALVKKLKERIQELELELQSKPTNSFKVKDLVETIQDYQVAQSRMAVAWGDLSIAHDAVKRERDAARSTLDDVRAVLNGCKLAQ